MKQHQNSLFCDCHLCDPLPSPLVTAMRRIEALEADVMTLTKVNAKLSDTLRLIGMAADMKGALMKEKLSKMVREALKYEKEKS